MTTDDLYQFFGSVKQITHFTGVKGPTFYAWVKRNHIPYEQQKHIEMLTKGKLTAIDYRQERNSCSFHLPMFRYYDKRYGMCDVESIHFRKYKAPKIVYIKEGNKREKISSFITKNIMQAVNLTDMNGKNVYEGDILLLKNKEKFYFRSLDMLSKLRKLGKFKIIGNVFE